MRRFRFTSAVRRLAFLASLSLPACETVIGLGDLERAQCSNACHDGGGEPIASTSGSGSGDPAGGSTPTTSSGAPGTAGTGAPPSGAGGTRTGGSSGGGGTNETPYVNGGAGSAAGTATEGSSGGASDVGGGGTDVGGQSPSGGTQSGGGDTPNLPIRINFQLLGADVPTGYVPDTGLTFAAQDGLSFGWNVDHTDVTRDRGVNSSQLLDTLCQFHEGGVWELALPNGTYNVLVTVGDPSLASTYTLIVEGVTYWRARLIGPNQFVSNTSSITVADGRLTLSQGTAGELATRINFIEVSAP